LPAEVEKAAVAAEIEEIIRVSAPLDSSLQRVWALDVSDRIFELPDLCKLILR
jgi:hypothetical protein